MAIRETQFVCANLNLNRWDRCRWSQLERGPIARSQKEDSPPRYFLSFQRQDHNRCCLTQISSLEEILHVYFQISVQKSTPHHQFRPQLYFAEFELLRYFRDLCVRDYHRTNLLDCSLKWIQCLKYSDFHSSKRPSLGFNRANFGLSSLGFSWSLSLFDF